MYVSAEHEISRQHREEIRQEVAAYRLEKLVRRSRGGARASTELGVGAYAFRRVLGKLPRYAPDHVR